MNGSDEIISVTSLRLRYTHRFGENHDTTPNLWMYHTRHNFFHLMFLNDKLQNFVKSSFLYDD